MQIKLAIVEHDPRFRAAFAGAIAAADDMTLVAAADDLPAGLARAGSRTACGGRRSPSRR